MKELMGRYQVDNLVGGRSPEEFQGDIEGLIGIENWKEEGYDTPEGQRMHSIKYVWGHNHDFGSFQLKGAMGDRHIKIFEKYAEFGMPTNLERKKVLDIGCWTGGMSLMLYAMHPEELVVLEEVVKYANTVKYLRRSFGLHKMEVNAISLYDYQIGPRDYFDIVNLSGVLYHVTDVILALKIVVDRMKIGGMLLLETGVTFNLLPTLTFYGQSKNTPKIGYNWFFPSWSFLRQAFGDLGLEIIQSNEKERNTRGILIAVKRENKPMMKCGVSIRV